MTPTQQGEYNNIKDYKLMKMQKHQEFSGCAV